MAEVANPSAVDMAVGGNTTEAPKQATRPERPDEETFKTELAELEKAHQKNMDALNKIRAKTDNASRAKDSPAAKKMQELRNELSGIRKQQSENKSSRGNVQEKVASLDAQLKSRIQEQKAARSRVPYKSVEEVDKAIARYEKDVDSGTMKLVDEKKALSEISSLRKVRKNFGTFDEAEKTISDLKTQIAELRKGMDSPEAKALSERYTAIQKELDELKAEQDGAFKNINALRDERTALQTKQQESYQAIRKRKDTYYQARNAYRDYEHEARKVRAEKQKSEREAWNKEKRKKAAAERLEDASHKAFTEEITIAENLIRYFDPSTTTEVKSLHNRANADEMVAKAQRTVDGSNIKGTVLSKKEDREDNYFAGTGGKKGKKGKKGGNGTAAAAPAETKYNLSIGVLEQLGKVGVSAPSNEGEVKATVEKLKEKVATWKADQDTATKDNVAKAQAEIDRLEAEAIEEEKTFNKSRATDVAKKPAQANQAVNGSADADAELKQEQDAVKDATEDLKAAKLEDA